VNKEPAKYSKAQRIAKTLVHVYFQALNDMMDEPRKKRQAL
jgi:hypothetical protein